MSNHGNLYCTPDYLTFIRIHPDQATSVSSKDQLLFSKISIVSFLVTQQKIKDPIINILYFKNWIKNSVQFKSLEKEYCIVIDIKNKIRNQKSKINKIFLICNFLFSFSFILFVKRYFFGDDLGFRMSKLWIKKNK